MLRSKGSFDTEVWSNRWKLSFAITGMNYIWKYKKIIQIKLILIFM